MSDAFFRIWEFIVNLSEPVLLYLILRSKLKCTPVKNIIALFGIVLLASITTALNFRNVSYVLTNIIALCDYILYAVLLFEGKFIQKVLWGTAMLFILLVSNTVLVNIAILLPSVSAVDTFLPTQNRFIFMLVYMLLNTSFAFALIKFTKKGSTLPFYIVTGIVCLCLLSTASLYLMSEIAYEMSVAGLDANVCVIVSVILLTLTVFVVILFNRLSKSIQRTINAQKEAIALQREIAYNNELENVYRDLRQLRHDYASHLGVIVSLLENNSIDELKDYMSEYHGEYKSANYYALTDNTKLDALLSSKLSLSESRGIKTSVAFRYWGDIGLSSVELVSMFGNLLDNAMNACENIEDGRRAIRLTTKKVRDMLSISVSNTYDGTSREDGAQRPGHGMGLPRIRAIVEKYDGICEITQTEDIFEVEIMLRLRS